MSVDVPRLDLPELPALVRGQVTHRRRGPVRHAFRHHVYQWLVDLDQLPKLPLWLRPTARFDARDHLGGGGTGAAGSIRDNVDRYLASRSIELGAGGRVLMLTTPRVLGYTFNPLTVFWCLGGDSLLRCIVAEVHNTYGERHVYLLEPDGRGRARSAKEFYVSPFNDVSGEYDLRFRLTPQRIHVSVTLTRDGGRVFEAAFAGVPAPATSRRLTRLLVWRPLMPVLVTGLIRWHGMRLWLRRLPVGRDLRQRLRRCRRGVRLRHGRAEQP